MTELWQRISNHKVPGLTVLCMDKGRIKVRTEHTCIFADCHSPTYEAHRAAAMLVVDAYEKTGLLFCRHKTSQVVIWSQWRQGEIDNDFLVSSEDHDGDEAKTLLTLLAEVGDVIGELEAKEQA